MLCTHRRCRQTAFYVFSYFLHSYSYVLCWNDCCWETTYLVVIKYSPYIFLRFCACSSLSRYNFCVFSVSSPCTETMLCVTFLSTRKRCFEYIFLLQLLHLVYVTFFSVFFFRFHAKQRAIIENNKNNERKTRKENETYHCEFLWMWLNPRVSRCRTENKISFRLHPVCGSKNVDVCVFLSQLLHLYLLRRFGVTAIVCFTLYSIFSSFLVCLSIYCLCCAVLCVSCHFVGLFFLFSVVIVDIHCLAGDSAGSCWKFLYRPCECACVLYAHFHLRHRALVTLLCCYVFGRYVWYWCAFSQNINPNKSSAMRIAFCGNREFRTNSFCFPATQYLLCWVVWAIVFLFFLFFLSLRDVISVYSFVLLRKKSIHVRRLKMVLKIYLL